MEKITQSTVFNEKWNIDQDGFLRCRTTVLKSGVFNYMPSELANVPDKLKTKAELSVYIPQDEVNNNQALKTLEGKPITIGHDWKSVENYDAVGVVSGKPEYKDGFVYSDILVNDKDAINYITNRSLVEQSAGYTTDIDWVSGIAPNGKKYDGIQKNLNFNHVALLTKGKARCGEEVRILNKKNKVVNVNYKEVKIGNSTIRVLNEDVNKLNDEYSTLENKCSDGKSAVSDLEKVINEKATLKSEIDKLKGMNEELNTQLSEAKNPQIIQNAAVKIAKEREQVQKVLNSFSLELKNINDLAGVELIKSAVNAVRVKNGKEKLNNNVSDEYIKGAFSVISESALLNQKPNGSQVITNMQPKAHDNKSKIEKMYGSK